jgi:ketosteroid isomerase-like protein
LQGLDTEALVGSYADDFVFEDTAAGETITGRDELSGYFQVLFSIPDVAFSDITYFEAGDRAAAEWVWSGTRPDGQPFAVRGASFFELSRVGIVREAVFYDPRPAFS